MFEEILKNNKLPPKNLKAPEQKFEQVYKDGLSQLRMFLLSSGKDRNSLKKAIEKLNESTNLKKNEAEPYFYLSYIFFICQEKEKAKKYSEVVRLINPQFKGLVKLEKLISKNSSF